MRHHFLLATKQENISSRKQKIFSTSGKGQLISKCLLGVIVSIKIPTKNVTISALAPKDILKLTNLYYDPQSAGINLQSPQNDTGEVSYISDRNSYRNY